jgi:ferrous iron transport protein A
MGFMNRSNQSLLRLKNGEGGIVKALPPGEAGRRLEALGLRPGKRIDRLSGMPFGGPVTICLDGRRLAIGYGVARRILVEISAALFPGEDTPAGDPESPARDGHQEESTS